MSKRRRDKKTTQPLKAAPGRARQYFLNILLFLTLSLILTSVAILILVIFEASEKKAAAVVTPPPAQVQDALVTKMGKIVTEPPVIPEEEEPPSEIADYTQADKVLEVIKPEEKAPKPQAKPAPKPEKKEPVIVAAPPKEKPTPAPAAPKATGPKPRLAIIIDDVSTRHQLKGLLGTSLPLSLSIFPPSSTTPGTPDIVGKLPFYMVHLPLEAMNFASPQDDTLTTLSTPDEMERVVRNIRKNFPKATMVNNHTGSKFTADEASMKSLMKILKRYDFTFVDSLTTHRSKAKAAARSVGMPFLKRDIFLDNKSDVRYIKNQLKKAVIAARQNGFAIAIGHPKTQTIQALKHAGDILKDVDVVYVNELL